MLARNHYAEVPGPTTRNSGNLRCHWPRESFLPTLHQHLVATTFQLFTT